MLKKRLHLLAAILIVVAPQFATAQDDIPGATGPGKPVAAVSISSIDDVLKKVSTVSTSVGTPLPPQAIDGMIQQMLGIDPALPGLDKSKPIIVGFFLPAGGPEAIMTGFCVCLPTTDKDQLLATVGAEDNGDGSYSVFNMPAVVKESNGYLMAAMSPAVLDNMPADPASLVGTLPQNYVVAARGLVQDLPKELREGLTSMIEQAGTANVLQTVGAPDEIAAAVDVLNRQLAQLQRFINDTSDVVVGVGVDDAKNSIHLDFSSTAIPDSETAKIYGMLKPTPSNHAGVLAPDAALTGLISTRYAKTPEDAAAIDAQHQLVRARALSQLDADRGVPAAVKEAAKEAVGNLIDVAFGTFKAESVDAGVALFLDNKSTFVFGGYIADGDGFTSSLKQIAAIAQQDGFPPVQWDAENHGGYALHSMQIPQIVDGDIKRMVGDNVTAVLATSANSVYLAIGGDSANRVKSIIDASAAAKATPQDSFQVNVAVKPFLEMNAPELLEGIGTLLDQKGSVHITAQGIKDGVRTRIEVEENVIKAIPMLFSATGSATSKSASPEIDDLPPGGADPFDDAPAPAPDAGDDPFGN
jgi:hypothetical protein